MIAGDTISIMVSDDGRGFDPAAVGPDHFGLRSMRGRADSKHTWIGKVHLNCSVARMVHRLVLTVGGARIGGLGDSFLAAAPSR